MKKLDRASVVVGIGLGGLGFVDAVIDAMLPTHPHPPAQRPI